MVYQQAENSVESKVNTTSFDTISLPVDRTFDSLPRNYARVFKDLQV